MESQKVAFVTGVSSGIGQAIASAFVKEGFRTFGTVRDSSKRGQRNGEIEFIQLDVRDENSVRAAVKAVLDQTGRIDVLVNSAGVALIGASEETSLEEARQLFDTNFFGVLRLTQEILPVMRAQRSGRIVNISSVVGFLPAPYMAVYAASKHAIEGYSESLDHELRRFGVRVSLVEPGFTRTNLGKNGRVARDLNIYAEERTSAIAAITEAINQGDEPATAAAAVLKAVTDRKPRSRYQAGREARLLSRLHKWAPSTLLDRGIRKQFGLLAIQ